MPTALVAKELLDLVAELYIAGHAADSPGLTGNAKLEFRRERAGPIRTRIEAWLGPQRPRHPPKSPIDTAIRHAENHWQELGVFLDDDRVPLDKNGDGSRRLKLKGPSRRKPSTKEGKDEKE